MLLLFNPRKSHRADATACSKRMEEGCPSSKPVPFAVFDCKGTKKLWKTMPIFSKN